MKRMSRFGLGCSAVLALLVSGSPVSAQVAGGSSGELRKAFFKAVEGKTVAYVPVAMGMPLTEGWANAIRGQIESVGMKFVLRDPNWNTQAESQAVSALVAQKPAVLVVHNPNVQLLAKQLEDAQKKGIFVIQINMVSNFKTDAFVGVDYEGLGRTIAREIVKDCGTGTGASGKIAIVQGEITSGASIDQLRGAMEVLNADKAIKVVSNQAANWDASKANEVTATVLQKHRDLCATYGFWDVMEMGAAQAVRTAGLTGKVKVYASGDGHRLSCDAVQSGAITKNWNFDALGQGRDIAVAAKMLLQSGLKPGQMKVALYSSTKLMTKENLTSDMCWDLPKKN